ncbi:MAG: cysteine hydrolase [Acidobacteriota bacterium]|nr:cysteine hydrolase [Acidobacteriota bacterium]
MTPVFFDIDTQNDFVLPAGSLYAPGAERIIPAIAALNRYAADHGIPLISTMCSHAENDPEFRDWPAHCVRDTAGQRKPAATLVPGQTILEKQDLDIFRSPKLQPLLNQFDASEYIVYGVVTEVCVKFAAEGLLNLRKPVTVVTDAVQALEQAAADMFLERFCRAGGRLTTAAAITHGGFLRPSSL